MSGVGFYINGPGSYATVDLADGLDIVADAGFASIDVSASKGERVLNSSDYSRDERAWLRSAASDRSLAIEAVVTHLGLADTILSGRALDLPGAIDVAEDLGAHLVLVHVGRRIQDRDSELWSGAVKLFRQAADRAGPRGITVCLDALSAEFLTASPESVNRFLVEVDRSNVGWNFDPAMLITSGFDVESAVSILGRWIRHAHIKDVRGRYPDHEWVIPGEGVLDHSAWANVLRRIGYHGVVTAEVIATIGSESPKWPLEYAARTSHKAIAEEWQ